MSRTTFEQLYLSTPFSTPTSSRVSPRAAFQQVLAGDAVLVTREPVHPRLEPLGLSVSELAGVTGPVVLMCANGTLSAFAAEALRRLGAREVRAVEGGFAAWVEAGLPTA
jgi:rhodanese-related sulfurtransferase